MARLILEYRLSGSEVRGAVQICLRRGVGSEIGVEETVRLRPVIERRYVQIGRVTDASVAKKLASMSPEGRANILKQVLGQIGLTVLEMSLSERGYALVLSEETASTSNADTVEQSLNKALRANVEEG